MTDFKPGDRVKDNGGTREWIVSTAYSDGRTDITHGPCRLIVLNTWLAPVTPPLAAALADAQPGDVISEALAFIDANPDNNGGWIRAKKVRHILDPSSGSGLEPREKPLPAVLANAQPGDVVRADGRVWKFNGKTWKSMGGHYGYTAQLAALDPNPVRLVPLPSVEECRTFWRTPMTVRPAEVELHDWLADRERGTT